MRNKFLICILLFLISGLVGCTDEEREAVKGTIYKYYDGFIDGSILQIADCLHPSFEGRCGENKEGHLASAGIALLAFDFVDAVITYDRISIYEDLAEVTAQVTQFVSILGQVDMYSEGTIHFVLKKEGTQWLILHNF